MNLPLFIYLIALVDFILAGVYKWNSLDWTWLAFCTLYMLMLSIWAKIQ